MVMFTGIDWVVKIMIIKLLSIFLSVFMLPIYIIYWIAQIFHRIHWLINFIKVMFSVNFVDRTTEMLQVNQLLLKLCIFVISVNVIDWPTERSKLLKMFLNFRVGMLSFNF